MNIKNTVVLIGLCLLPSAQGQAQPACSEAIQIVVPYTAGGTIDGMARLLREPLAKSLGCSVVIINKPGAAGAIGTREVARARPDGNTLLLANNGPHTILPIARTDLEYDGVKDFAPVSLVATSPLLLIANPGVPAKDLKSLLEYGRANPGKLTYASSGIGSLAHLASVLFAHTAGIDALHIPYKGQSETVNAVISGEVAFAITSPSGTITSNIEAGKLKLLGVSSEGPSPLAPGTPPIATVLKGYSVEFWFGLLAPAATPPVVVERLNKTLVAALANLDIQQRFKDMGVLATSSPPADLKRLMMEESVRWSRIVREAHIKMQ